MLLPLVRFTSFGMLQVLGSPGAVALQPRQVQDDRVLDRVVQHRHCRHGMFEDAIPGGSGILAASSSMIRYKDRVR